MMKQRFYPYYSEEVRFAKEIEQDRRVKKGVTTPPLL